MLVLEFGIPRANLNQAAPKAIQFEMKVMRDPVSDFALIGRGGGCVK